MLLYLFIVLDFLTDGLLLEYFKDFLYNAFKFLIMSDELCVFNIFSDLFSKKLFIIVKFQMFLEIIILKLIKIN